MLDAYFYSFSFWIRKYIGELADLFYQKWEMAGVMNLESWNRLNHQIISSFHIAPDWKSVATSGS